MKRQDLLKSKEYWTIQIQSDLYELIEKYMSENKLNRTDLAKKFEVGKSYITQLLAGDFDHKISKFVDLCLRVGKAPIVHYVDLEKYIEDDNLDKEYLYKPNFKPVQYNINFYMQQSNLTEDTDIDVYLSQTQNVGEINLVSIDQ